MAGMKDEEFLGGAGEQKGEQPDVHIVDGENLSEEDSHHHLHRGLKSRQITMIAIGGAIGTGLIIGTYVPSPIWGYLDS